MGRLSDHYSDLFGDAYARSTDPSTSHIAARSMRPRKANTLEKLVYLSIAAAGIDGLICDDIVNRTGLNWNTVSPRLKPLTKKGYIKPKFDFSTGRFVTRNGKSNRPQTVWIICE